ncbi:hypothetical protein RFN30_16870 [Mesorhizobium sp. VK23D]|nr:hypothetical protein [Mesorhizobium sp. VK23D]
MLHRYTALTEKERRQPERRGESWVISRNANDATANVAWPG